MKIYMMHLDWLTSPITVYAMLAVALVIALVLFFSLKVEIAAARQLAQQAARAAEEIRTALTAQIEALRAVPAPVTEVVAVPPGEGLNLTRRASALRMERRGEGVATIAAALRVPQNEVELLLKLQKLSGQTESQPS